MSILNKPLNREALATLDLFLQGALAPLNGYLNRADHLSVLQENRLANGYLWSLPFTLALTATEKRQAQLAGRIALIDEEQRTIAEVEIEDIYRLPTESGTLITTQTNVQNQNSWYVGGTIKAVSKVLHPAFNRIRRTSHAMQNKLNNTNWQQIIAVHTSEQMQYGDMRQACAWLKENDITEGGILLQVSATHSPQLHEEMRVLRSNIRCNSAKQVVLSLLPATSQLDITQQLLLQARIAKNYGATAFLIPSSVPVTTRKALLRHRDELGLDLIPARRSKTTKPQTQHYMATEQKIAA